MRDDPGAIDNSAPVAAFTLGMDRKSCLIIFPKNVFENLRCAPIVPAALRISPIVITHGFLTTDERGGQWQWKVGAVTRKMPWTRYRAC